MRTPLTPILVLALATQAAQGVPLKGAIAADHALAQQAGERILATGGNAVDAAVATAFALSVVRPESCGIGGGGFMLIHLVDDPRTEAQHDPVDIAIDFRERAPGAITPTTFADLPPEASTHSGLAVAVPGTVAGLLDALEHFGTFSRDKVLAPAIELARTGYSLDAHGVDAVAALRAEIGSDRPDTAARTFMGRFIPQDPANPTQTSVRFPEQADVLERIAKDGRDAFYTGEVAQAIVQTVTSRGGVMTLEDLAAFKAIETAPLRARTFGGRTILAMPLPSSGGVCILQCLATLQERGDLLANAQRSTPAYLHVIAESLKLAFADRARFLADPECTDMRAEPMLDPKRINARAMRISNMFALKFDDPSVLAPLPNDAGTSHLCAVDKWGNAVSCTDTINLEFGSCIPVCSFGFFLNNEMDDFLTKPGRANAFALTQAQANLPGPHKRPLSSMAPTIALDLKGDVELVIGASGGPRIISATLQVLLDILMFRLEPQRAVDWPRIHQQWQPDEISIEKNRPVIVSIMQQFQARGWVVVESPQYADVQCIARDPKNPNIWNVGIDFRVRGQRPKD